jgi:hypothetical protein
VKRSTQRALIADRIDSIFAPTEQKKRKPTPYDVKYKRATFRITDDIHSGLKDVAKERGVGLNDLVRWVLGDFLERYEDGGVELPIEEYVVTVSRLT